MTVPVGDSRLHKILRLRWLGALVLTGALVGLIATVYQLSGTPSQPTPAFDIHLSAVPGPVAVRMIEADGRQILRFESEPAITSGEIWLFGLASVDEVYKEEFADTPPADLAQPLLEEPATPTRVEAPDSCHEAPRPLSPLAPTPTRRGPVMLCGFILNGPGDRFVLEGLSPSDSWVSTEGSRLRIRSPQSTGASRRIFNVDLSADVVVLAGPSMGRTRSGLAEWVATNEFFIEVTALEDTAKSRREQVTFFVLAGLIGALISVILATLWRGLQESITPPPSANLIAPPAKASRAETIVLGIVLLVFGWMSKD